MEPIAARYDRLAAAFADKVRAVPPGRWDAPSPCEQWTALDVVRHVVETPRLFFGFVGREPGPVPPVEDGPAEAFEAVRRQVQADLDDPARAGAEFDGFFGRSTFAEAVDRFLSFDLLVHGWDLARAAGLDEAIAEPDLEWLERAAAGFGDAMRGPQAFGPALEPPADADRQTRLLAFLGRRA